MGSCTDKTLQPMSGGRSIVVEVKRGKFKGMYFDSSVIRHHNRNIVGVGCAFVIGYRYSEHIRTRY